MSDQSSSVFALILKELKKLLWLQSSYWSSYWI